MTTVKTILRRARTSYMNNHMSHEAYYLLVARKLEIGADMVPVSIDRLLQSTDEHLSAP